MHDRPGQRHLDPELVARLSHLTVRARAAADGALTGLHRSPHRGASVVFVEHREYRPGDDPRLLDWRAFARTDRPTLKRFEQETQLTATLLLDASASMDFRGDPGRPTKSEHAATLLGGLALILLRQGDRVGGVSITDRVHATVPHASGSGHLEPLLRGFVSGPSGAPTDLAPALAEALPRAGRRGLVVLASDLLDREDDGVAALRAFAAKNHDVWVLHVLDPAEIELDLPNACRVRGLEGEPMVEIPGTSMKDAYRKAIEAFIAGAERAARAIGVSYLLARTDEDPALTLARMLGRQRGGGPSRGRDERHGKAHGVRAS
jgi:uncharacterized protein (DUF58 family)